jgi:alginate O-acetyltransferase complex protein AlgJ
MMKGIKIGFGMLGAVTLLSVLIFFLLGKVLQPELEVHVQIKSLEPSHFTVAYTPDHPDSNGESRVEALMASQFFSDHVFRFRSRERDRSLKIFLDEKTPLYILRRLEIMVNRGYRQDTILALTGQEVLNAFLGKQGIGGYNEHSVELKNSKSGQGFFFTASVCEKIRTAMQNDESVCRWHILASVIISLTLVLLFFSRSTQTAPVPVFAWKKLSFSAVFFFLLLAFILLNSLFRFIPDRQTAENRTMAELEQPDAYNVFRYPEILTTYTNDHFAFRNWLFFAHSLIRAKALQTASLPNRIIIGDKGWFFEVDDFAMKDYRRLNRFTDRELADFVRIMKERTEWLQARGIRYYVMVPPNRNRIYSELFPGQYAPLPHHGHNKLDFFRKYLREQIGFDLLDPSDSLLYYKQFHDVYYSTDSHWNQFGAWVGYSVLVHAMKKDFPCLQPLTYSELCLKDSFSSKGDLAALLDLQDVYRRKEFRITACNSGRPVGEEASPGILLRMENPSVPDSCGIKVILFRDSYSNYMIPYLNRDIRELVVVWSYDFLHELIETEKPDAVVLEVQQRAMIYGLQNPNFFKTAAP